MPVLKAILLGLIQGVTGLLPVSSSGHAVLIASLLGLSDEVGLQFLSLLQCGTLAALVYCFRKDIRRLFPGFLDVIRGSFANLRILLRSIRNPEKGDYRRVLHTVYGRFSIMLCVSMLPTILIALALYRFAELGSSSLLATGCGFAITALILFIASFSDRKNRQPSHTRFRDAILIGVLQGFSVFPGISRVGMVLAGAEFAGFSRKYTVKYTMLLGIPTILGSIPTGAIKTGVSLADTVGIGSCIAGILTAAVISWLMIRIATKLLSIRTNKFFAAYSLIMGIICIVNYMH